MGFTSGPCCLRRGVVSWAEAPAAVLASGRACQRRHPVARWRGEPSCSACGRRERRVAVCGTLGELSRRFGGCRILEAVVETDRWMNGGADAQVDELDAE